MSDYPLFYAPDAIAGTVELDEEESMHCARVLRLGGGDRIMLADGVGGRHVAEIVTPHPKHLTAVIVSSLPFQPAPLELHVAVAPTKNIDRTEWLVEKCTEMGCTDFDLLLTAHSERKHLNEERLRKIALSAMKQSQRAWLPRIHPLTPFADFAAQCVTQQKLIAHCEETERFGIHQVYRAGESVTVLIGPEGDFSPEEIALAVGSGFRPVTLGDMRLRTETAAVVACHSIVFLNEMQA